MADNKRKSNSTRATLPLVQKDFSDSFTTSSIFKNISKNIAISSPWVSAFSAISNPIVPPLKFDWNKLTYSPETLSSIKSFEETFEINLKALKNFQFLFANITSAPANINEDTDTPLRQFFDTSTSGISFENKLNSKRLMKFKNEFSKSLIALIKEQDFEYGFYSLADNLVRQCLKENEVVAKQWLNELFISNFSDVVITVGLLRVISHLDYELIAPQGITMAVAALSHRNPEVKECGIRAFENWGNAESLQVLKNITCEQEWLQSYLQQVISDLTAELS